MDHLGVNSTCRASFAFYNTEADVKRFLDSVAQIRRKMGYE
jgi:cysteine desulfurase/selenocysteine lyase